MVFVELLWWIAAGAAPATGAAGGALELSPVVVSASRVAQDQATLPLRVDVFTTEELHASPALTVDDALRSAAAFALFRRSGSLSANPTAQGVSLRGIGPSGASRSLVLLDGVPLNDPFGGWVAWQKIAQLALSRVEIVRGGGSGAWGNAALGGVIQLSTVRPAEAGNAVSVDAGEAATSRAEVRLAANAGTGHLLVDARHFSTDGFPAIDPVQRGPVDQPVGSRHTLAQVSWEGAPTPATHAAVTGRWFDETRGNGTPLQRNASREGFVSGRLSGSLSPDHSWDAVVYGQRQQFSSFFSSVAADRRSETPANDQFDVPATAAGAALSTTWDNASGATVAGVDARWVQGETREDYLFAGDRFTRRRIAGGEQQFVGIFMHHHRALHPRVRLSVDLRGDAWANTDGHRRETDRATGAVVRDDRSPAHRGTELSPQVGLSWQLTEQWRLRGAAYRAFRVPTLNEYYRPFRVGATNTEANPALRPETLVGGEAGVEFRTAFFQLTLTGFTAQLDDAVGNVTLARTPALISRQRQNLDEVRARGVELGLELRPADSLRLRLDGIANDARVRRSAAQPALEHRELAQVPRQAFVASVDWRPRAPWSVSARYRRVGRQFEDDENALPLAPANTVDLRLARQVGRQGEVFVAVENLLDARIETGRSTEDIVSIGMPRLARAGVRWFW